MKTPKLSPEILKEFESIHGLLAKAIADYPPEVKELIKAQSSLNTFGYAIIPGDETKQHTN